MSGDTGAKCLFAENVPMRLKLPNATSSPDRGALSPKPTHKMPTVSKTLNVNGVPPSESYLEKSHPGINVQVSMAELGNTRSRTLEIRLADETDPFFLYQMDIAEDDFPDLRSEQNLLVDFQSFPKNLVGLLEEVLVAQQKSSSNPKFIAQLTACTNASYANFEIIETNAFRNIVHISLKFIPGTDSMIKQYLAQLVNDFKQEIQSLRHQNESLEENLSSESGKRADLTRELDALRVDSRGTLDQALESLKTQHARELARERDNFETARETERQKFESSMRALEHDLSEKINSLSQELASARTSRVHLEDQLDNLRGPLNDSQRQAEKLSNDLSNAQGDLRQLTSINRDLSREKSDLQLQCVNHQKSISDLKSLNDHMTAQLQRLENITQNASEEKSKLHDALENLTTQNERLEVALKQSTDEIGKGNEIIKKMQSDLKSAKAKLKLKNVVTVQQEKLLDERGSTLEVQKHEVTKLQDAVSRLSADLASSKSNEDELRAQLNSAKVIIEDNSHVIEWLHKQLNENALTRPVETLKAHGMNGSASLTYSNTHPSGESLSKNNAAVGYRSRYLQDAENCPPPKGPEGHDTSFDPARSLHSRNTSPQRNLYNPSRPTGLPLGSSMGGTFKNYNGGRSKIHS
ncbi:hypothetical protein DFS34DRAFT_410176 [Phlyctochytrium arcticum]|nr:hypothetical protein DFS34DRAFT_410176 [Phlyctochytrium arcticum]